MVAGGRGSGQDGYTLVELIIALAIGVLLMTALTSVVLTTWRGVTVASSRVEASDEVRNFEFIAYADFAASGLPVGTTCTDSGSPCTTQPLVLSGVKASNSTSPTASPYQVTYTWDGSNFVNRQVASTGATSHAASSVTAFSWWVDSNSTVVVRLTVKVQEYSESQTFRFYPRLNP